MWLTMDAQEMWPQAVPDATNAFRRVYPNVDVKVVFQPFADHTVKFSTAIAAGSPPDVMEFFTDETQKLIGAGEFQDLTAAKSGFDNSSTWRDFLVQSCTAGGKLYCVPYYADSKNDAIVSGADLAVPSGAKHPEWSTAWIKAFTATAIEQQIAKVGARPPYKVLANTTAIP